MNEAFIFHVEYIITNGRIVPCMTSLDECILYLYNKKFFTENELAYSSSLSILPSCNLKSFETLSYVNKLATRVQLWWLGGRAVASHTVESGRTLSRWIESGLVWHVNCSVVEILCPNSQCRTPDPLGFMTRA